MQPTGSTRQRIGSLFRGISDAVRKRLLLPRSIRFTFAYDEAGIRLIDRTSRMKPPPPSDRLDAPLRPDTIVAELRIASGAVLYRKLLRDPIPQDVEVFSPDASSRRLAMAPARGSFSVVVPSVRRAEEVVIEAGPAVVLQQFAAARPEQAQDRYVLGRFRFRRGDHGL